MTRPFSLEEQITCVRREVGLRRRVYPNRVFTGRMSRDKADYEIGCMEAVLERLEALAPMERLV